MIIIQFWEKMRLIHTCKDLLRLAQYLKAFLICFWYNFLTSWYRCTVPECWPVLEHQIDGIPAPDSPYCQPATRPGWSRPQSRPHCYGWLSPHPSVWSNLQNLSLCFFFFWTPELNIIINWAGLTYKNKML